MVMMADSFLWEVIPIGSFLLILMGLSVTKPALWPQELSADTSPANESTLPLATKACSKGGAHDPDQPITFFPRSYIY